MKRLTILILILLTLTNCRSRKRIKETTKIDKKELSNIKFNSLDIKKDSVIKLVDKKKIETKKIDRNDGEIIIKGKTDSIKPFEFHNVVNGDTISSITIYGNSDFEIKNNWKKSEEKSEINNVEKNLNFVANISRNAVSKKTIKKVAEEFKGVTTEVKSKGFSAPVYVIIGVVLLVCGILYTIIRTYKKK